MDQKEIGTQSAKEPKEPEAFFPDEFISKYRAMLGEEWPAFLEAIQKKRPRSFWVNTNIAGVAEVKRILQSKRVEFEQLPFHEQAFIFTNTKGPKASDLEVFKTGKISLQEMASMMPVVALAPNKNDYVLDACSAPGMKTIQLSNLAGKVLATDVHSKRLETLNKIVKKYALKNVEVKRIDFRNIKRNRRFDKVLLDAPCSSEGVVRKQSEALMHWSQALVLRKAAEQKKLILKAFDYLKEGGEMIYSTCSFAPEENEEVVHYLLDKRPGAKIVPVEELLKGVKIRENKLCPHCVRLYPQDNDTQQFFLVKIRKEKA